MAASWAFAQVPAEIQAYRLEPHGDRSALLKGTMYGNHIRSRYFNTSELCTWPDGNGMEWLGGTGHCYILTALPIIGARFRLFDSVTATVVEGSGLQVYKDPFSSPRYRSGLEPVPGYSTTNTSSVIVNTGSRDWPAAWNGRWHGLDGTDSIRADFETFSVTDDARCVDLGQPIGSYRPVASDSARHGLGLRIETWGLQWNRDSLAQDILFFVYDVINLSDFDYDSTAIGLIVIPGVGYHQFYGPDQAVSYSPSEDMIVASAQGGLGYPDNWKTGLLGITLVESPEKPATDTLTNGIAGFATHAKADTSRAGFSLGNDSTLWRVMTSGIRDTTVSAGAMSFVVAGKPFALPKWSRRRFGVAYMIAMDRERLSRLGRRAHQIAAAGYRWLGGVTDVQEGPTAGNERSFSLSQNYPNPFNPTSEIRYQISEFRMVRLAVYDLLGREVAVFVNEMKAPGMYEVRFDGANLPSGVYFYRLEAGSYSETKKLLLVR
jgi:hypothetical protein